MSGRHWSVTGFNYTTYAILFEVNEFDIQFASLKTGLYYNSFNN